MTPFIILALWSTIGLLLAIRTAMPGRPRFAVARVDVIQSPLSAPVAPDRRTIADDLRSQRMR